MYMSTPNDNNLYTLHFGSITLIKHKGKEQIRIEERS